MSTWNAIYSLNCKLNQIKNGVYILVKVSFYMFLKLHNLLCGKDITGHALFIKILVVNDLVVPGFTRCPNTFYTTR